MPARCIVAGCSNTTKDGVSLHCFPKDENLRKIWTAKVKITRAEWQGPSDRSLICSAHFTEDDFDGGLFAQLGISRKKMLKPHAVPSKIKVPDTQSQKETAVRGAALKRERMRVINELLSSDDSQPAQDAPDAPPQSLLDEQMDQDNEPGCSQDTTTSELEYLSSVNVECETSSTRSCSTQTSVATRVKRTQKSVLTSSRGSQWVEQPGAPQKTFTSTGTMCKRGEGEEEDEKNGNQDSDSDSDTDDSATKKKRPESPGYVPDEAESSSEYDSTPQKPRKKICKRRVGRSPRVSLPTKPKVHVPPHEDTKYIVFEEQLLDLFRTCRECRSGNLQLTKRLLGTLLTITTECNTCDKSNKWESQPYYGRTPAGNVLLPAAVLFAGGSWTTTSRILTNMKVSCICEGTYNRVQRSILQPVIEMKWMKDQKKVIDGLRASGAPLTIAGDGRADSPGHSAKYGVYTALEVDANKIVDLQLVQSNEVKSSYHMELEGFKRVEAFIRSKDLVIGKLVTDRHRQLAAYVRDTLPGILHTFDVWHVAKGTQKKVHALAKQKNCEVLLAWEKSITNHLYWVASSTKDGEGNLREAKWNSLMNHIQGIHEGHSDSFPRCLHGDLQDHPKRWLKPGTMVCDKLESIISSTALVKDVKKMSCGQQTSSLESFHNIINQFAPKMKAYKYHGILSRIHLAALHYNANSDRKQATTSSGVKRFAVCKLKYKLGTATVKPVKEARDYSYIIELMADVSEFSMGKTRPPARNPSPPPLCSGHTYPSKEELIQQHHSRFSVDQDQ